MRRTGDFFVAGGAIFSFDFFAAAGYAQTSTEEIVVVLDGTVEATVGEERGELSAGGAVLIPTMVPHSVRNTGSTRARCIGFFGAAGVVSTFEDTVLPMGTNVLSTVAEATT